MSRAVEMCGNCKYHYANVRTGEWVCRRYPHYEVRSRGDWCGEWVPWKTEEAEEFDPYVYFQDYMYRYTTEPVTIKEAADMIDGLPTKKFLRYGVQAYEPERVSLRLWKDGDTTWFLHKYRSGNYYVASCSNDTAQTYHDPDGERYDRAREAFAALR